MRLFGKFLFSLFLIGSLFRPVLAIDPFLQDRLLDDDDAVRQKAYLEERALPVSDQINLAPFIADWLEDGAKGERAAQALCRLDSVGVPYLDRHARARLPGGEFAAMGLLAGTDEGPRAFAALLRDGEPDAVIRALAVVETSGLMPSVVGDEVRRLSTDNDIRFVKAAQAALHSVSEKAARGASPSGGGATVLKGMSDAEIAAALAKMQTLLSEAGAAPAGEPAAVAENAEGGKFSPRQPDTSGYRTRKSAADSFSLNLPEQN